MDKVTLNYIRGFNSSAFVATQENSSHVIHSMNYRFSRRKILILSFLILGLGLLLQIWVMNRLATLGEEITKIEVAKQALKMENLILENQVAKTGALLNIKPLVSNLGFTSSAKVEYIQPSGLAANR